MQVAAQSSSNRRYKRIRSDLTPRLRCSPAFRPVGIGAACLRPQRLQCRCPVRHWPVDRELESAPASPWAWRSRGRGDGGARPHSRRDGRGRRADEHPRCAYRARLVAWLPRAQPDRSQAGARPSRARGVRAADAGSPGSRPATTAADRPAVPVSWPACACDQCLARSAMPEAGSDGPTGARVVGDSGADGADQRHLSRGGPTDVAVDVLPRAGPGRWDHQRHQSGHRRARSVEIEGRSDCVAEGPFLRLQQGADLCSEGARWNRCDVVAAHDGGSGEPVLGVDVHFGR